MCIAIYYGNKTFDLSSSYGGVMFHFKTDELSLLSQYFWNEGDKRCSITMINCVFFLFKDILENDDVKLDNMFIASLVGDLVRVGSNKKIGFLFPWFNEYMESFVSARAWFICTTLP